MKLVSASALLVVLLTSPDTGCYGGTGISSRVDGFDYFWFNLYTGIDFVWDCENPNNNDTSSLACYTKLEVGPPGSDVSHSIFTECDVSVTEGGNSTATENCTCEARLGGNICTTVPCTVCDNTNPKSLEDINVQYNCASGTLQQYCPENIPYLYNATNGTSGTRKLDVNEEELKENDVSVVQQPQHPYQVRRKVIEVGGEVQEDELFYYWYFNMSTDLAFECDDVSDPNQLTCEMCLNSATTNSTRFDHCVTFTCTSTKGDGGDGDNVYEDCTCQATLNGNACTEDPCKVLGSGDLDETFAVEYDCVDLRGSFFPSKSSPNQDEACIACLADPAQNCEDICTDNGSGGGGGGGDNNGGNPNQDEACAVCLADPAQNCEDVCTGNDGGGGGDGATSFFSLSSFLVIALTGVVNFFFF